MSGTFHPSEDCTCRIEGVLCPIHPAGDTERAPVIPARRLAQEVIAAELCRIRGDVEPTPLALGAARNDADAIIVALARQGMYVEVAG